MVFTQVLLIRGVRVNKKGLKGFASYLLDSVGQVFIEFVSYKLKIEQKEVKKFLLDGEKDMEECDYICDLEDVLNDYISRFGIHIYSYPCCSELSGKYWIIGKMKASYNRVYLSCNSCSEYFCCDKCLGATTNGWYDVVHITDHVVRPSPKTICKFCFNDNRRDVEEDPRCDFCHFETFAPDVKVIENDFQVKGFDKRLIGWIKDKTPKFYYLLDDCLSCS